LLQLRNFLGLAQVAEFELAAPDKQKSGQPRLQQPGRLPSSSLREAGVKVTKVPDSCILSQPRSIV
jgi:hypothetical protein